MEELVKDIQNEQNKENEIIPKNIEKLLSEHGKEFFNDILQQDEEGEE